MTLFLFVILVIMNAIITGIVVVMQPSIVQKCALHIPHSAEWIARLRGPNYSFSLYKEKTEEEVNDECTCVLGGWGVGHILMYALITVFVPGYWKELFLIGLLWELIEYPFGAAYALDLVYNGFGIAIGLGIRSLVSRVHSSKSPKNKRKASVGIDRFAVAA